ncbi:solute carrier family 25 member 44-like isoform X1 [Saccostrea echinata]|uniref:solute carrier family 25 member 44-like isoform X1 n=1 Tax=Saccostrea echinata TaxID=191078 RepID=UPI002A807D48|nr:solute carrier family 25 member 44-like isoform X1 [Saccostrea echinata]
MVSGKGQPSVDPVVPHLVKPAVHRPNIIGMHMLDLYKYYPTMTLANCAMRVVYYPFQKVTILQQQQNEKEKIYKNVTDTFVKIYRRQGLSGLLRGVTFRVFGQILSSLTYFSIYEGVRELTSQPSIAGFTASCTASFIICPFDLINRHVILLSKKATSQQEVQILKSLQPLRFPKEIRHGGGWILESSVIKDVGNRHGLKGFWRALPLLMMYNGVHSALWWSSFEFVSGILASMYPETSRVLRNSASGIISGFGVATVTNGLSITTTRAQLKQASIREAAMNLYRDEGFLRFFTKGLRPRLLQNIIFSFQATLVYDSVKQFSLKEEYKSKVTW